MFNRTAKVKGLIGISLLLLVPICFVLTERAQTVVRVPRVADGVYWMAIPKPWFTRSLVLSYKNRILPRDDHDDSAPTIPGYYHKHSQRFPFQSVVVRRGYARFTTKVVRGMHFVFRGSWGTEFDEPSNIENVPFLKGTLFTYKRGKLIKRERVKFNHAVNA